MISEKDLFSRKLPDISSITFEELLSAENDPTLILLWWFEVKHMLMKKTQFYPQWAFGRAESRRSFASEYWDLDFIHELTEEILYAQLINKKQLKVWIVPQAESIQHLRGRLWLVCRNVLSSYRVKTINANIRRRMISIFKSMDIDIGKDLTVLPLREFSLDEVERLVEIAKKRNAEVEEDFDKIAESLESNADVPSAQSEAALVLAEDAALLDQGILTIDNLEASEEAHIEVVRRHFESLEQHHESQENKLSYIFDSRDLVMAAVALVDARATLSPRILELGVDRVLKGVEGSITSLKGLFTPFDPIIQRNLGEGRYEEVNLLTEISTVESYESMNRVSEGLGGSFPIFSARGEKGHSRASNFSGAGIDLLVSDPADVKIARKIVSRLDQKERICFKVSYPGFNLTQEQKLEAIGGLPGAQNRQKFGIYAKKLVRETIPNLLKEFNIAEEDWGSILNQMWILMEVDVE